EYQGIGAATRGDGPDRLGQRPCAAGERPLVKTEPAGFAIAHENVAFLEREPLCRVDETQLEKRVDADVTVTADAQVSARGQVVDRREDAVAEIGFGSRAQSDDCSGRGETSRFFQCHIRSMADTALRVDP